MKNDRLLSIETELWRFNQALSGQFREAIPIVKEYLTPEELIIWAEEGAVIARNIFRSWEAASEYFTVTPKILESLNFPQFFKVQLLF